LGDGLRRVRDPGAVRHRHIAVYLAEARRDRSWLFYLFAPWISACVFVLGTALALIEGSICIAMALPLFLVADAGRHP